MSSSTQLPADVQPPTAQPVVEAKCSAATSATTETEPTAAMKMTQPELKVKEVMASTSTEGPTVETESSTPLQELPEAEPIKIKGAISDANQYNEMLQQADSLLLQLSEKQPLLSEKLARQLNAITTQASSHMQENEELRHLDQRSHQAFMDHMKAMITNALAESESKDTLTQVESMCSNYKNSSTNINLRQFRKDFGQFVQKASYAMKHKRVYSSESSAKGSQQNNKQASTLTSLLNTASEIKAPASSGATNRGAGEARLKPQTAKASAFSQPVKRRKVAKDSEKLSFLRKIIMTD